MSNGRSSHTSPICRVVIAALALLAVGCSSNSHGPPVAAAGDRAERPASGQQAPRERPSSAARTADTPATATALKPAMPDPPITVAPGTNWKLARAGAGTAAFHNREYLLAKLPTEMKAAWIVQRAGGGEGDTGPLAGKIIADKPCTAYVAIMSHYNGKEVVQPAQLEGLADEGWIEVPGEFRLSVPPGEDWKWRVFSRSVDPGPVDLPSTAAPKMGIYFFKDEPPAKPAPTTRPTR